MKAIIQCADTGPLESLATMLQSIGVQPMYPCFALRSELRRIGCTLVLEIDGLMKGMGYDRPFDLPPAELSDMDRSDVVYVDVKAHRDYNVIVKRWPNLKNRILWYRIQGGRPEHVINERGDHGNEINPPCPVLTPNQWYKNSELMTTYADCSSIRAWDGPPSPNAYTCWPPFVRFDEYANKRAGIFANPICLIHGLAGWGYGALVQNFRERLGVRCYGAGSPDGLINHREIPARLANALCMVHLKSNDAPGYAIYEAMAAACPVVCTRRLIWRCRMQDLLIPGETCLVFDRETHDGLTPEDVVNCTNEVQGHLTRLADVAENRRIGEAGRERLREIMWRADRDGDSLREFMGRCFG